MLQDRKTDLVLPVFLQCFHDGKAMVSLSEDLIGATNEILKNDTPQCLNYPAIFPQTDPQAIQETVAAVEQLGHQCPPEDRSCLEQVYQLFEQDMKNAIAGIISPFASQTPASSTSKMGCLSNIFANLITSVTSVIKTFLYEAPKKIWEIGTAAWDYFFDQEKKSSTVAFLSSMMSAEMASALANWELLDFYNIMRSNFWNIFGSIRQFYFELIGCTEWSGAPYSSECLKKMNFSCPTCENITQFTCGLLGQLGAGMVLGGMMGTINSVSHIIKSKAASIVPSLIPAATSNTAIAKGLMEIRTSPLAQELTNKAGNVANQAGNISYQLGLKMGALTGILSEIKNELKVITGLGAGFKNLMAGNPVTKLYHYSYQKGKKITQQTVANKLVQQGMAGVEASLIKAKKNALHLQKIWDALEIHLPKLQQMSDPKKFNPVTFQKITADYLQKAQIQLEHLGFKVSPTPDGKGLRLEKDGKSVTYRPDFEIIQTRQFNNPEELIGRLKTHDQLLHDGRDPLVTAANPPFIQEILDSAKDSMGLFAATADGMDGFVYLAHLAFLPAQSTQPRKCKDLLLDAKLLGIEDVSEVLQEEPKPQAGKLIPLTPK